MKEFIEKLIGRLEERQAEAENEMHRLRSENYTLLCRFDRADIEENTSESFKDSIEIVKQLAEEYYNEHYFNLDNTTLRDCPKCSAKAQHRVNRRGAWACGCFECNTFKVSYDHVNAIRSWEDYCNEKYNGWIPCSERLPQLYENTSDVVLVCGNNDYQHMAFWCSDGKWRYCQSGMIKEPMDWIEIVAWQPLPEPYKKGGEVNE